MFNIEKCEKIELPQGYIYLGPSNAVRSVGYLELNPYSSLALHNRPVDEQLTQIKGICNMVVYEDKKGKILLLKEKEKLVIPSNIYHIHANPFNEKSVTYWEFDGDIVEIIDNIRKTAKK